MLEKSYLRRHKFISKLVDLNLPGLNRFAVFLSKLLIPKAPGEAFVFETIHGIKLIIDPSKDKGIEKCLYEFGSYEKGIINIIKKNLKTGQIFVDIGANIGLMSCYASNIVGENGKVLAFEANSKTSKILEKNCVLNNSKNVEIFTLGLGEKKSSALFYENWDVNRGGASFLKQSDEIGTEVEIDTIDNLLSEQKIDMVKIDVEGFELNVLKGGINVLKKNHPIFIIEVSSNREKTIGVAPSEIYHFINSIGNYKIFKLAGTKERISKLIEIKTENDLPNHDNLICFPS